MIKTKHAIWIFAVIFLGVSTFRFFVKKNNCDKLIDTISREYDYKMNFCKLAGNDPLCIEINNVYLFQEMARLDKIGCTHD